MRRKKVSLEKRLAWLRQRPELWKRVRFTTVRARSFGFLLYKSAHLRIVEEMKKAELLAPSTYYMDVPVHKYVGILRGLCPGPAPCPTCGSEMKEYRHENSPYGAIIAIRGSVTKRVDILQKSSISINGKLWYCGLCPDAWHD